MTSSESYASCLRICGILRQFVQGITSDVRDKHGEIPAHYQNPYEQELGETLRQLLATATEQFLGSTAHATATGAMPVPAASCVRGGIEACSTLWYLLEPTTTLGRIARLHALTELSAGHLKQVTNPTSYSSVQTTLATKRQWIESQGEVIEVAPRMTKRVNEFLSQPYDYFTLSGVAHGETRVINMSAHAWIGVEAATNKPIHNPAFFVWLIGVSAKALSEVTNKLYAEWGLEDTALEALTASFQLRFDEVAKLFPAPS